MTTAWKWTVAAMVCNLLSATVYAQHAEHQAGTAAPVSVTLKDKDGKPVGEATLSPADGGVLLKLRVWGLAPGAMAYHIHQHAICEPPEFNSAGLHFDPGGVYYNDPNRGHNGMVAPGNPGKTLMVGADGKTEGSTVFPNVTMGTDSHSVFADGGTAVIVHQNTSQLSPDTPTRTACGVITRPK
jgi:Cu-Zn family superoxide dismutase